MQASKNEDSGQGAPKAPAAVVPAATPEHVRAGGAALALEAAAYVAWIGMHATVGYVVAPALFANLEKMKAGDIAGQLFHAVSYCSFACCAVLLAMGFAAAPGFARKARFWLLSACAALVAVSEFLLTPVIEALKKGTRDALLLRAFPVDSFAAWHGASQAAYLLTLIVLLAHFWLWARSLNRIVP